MKVFELVGSVVIDTARAVASLRDVEDSASQTESRLNSMSDGMRHIGDNISNAGRKIRDIGGGITAGFTLPMVGAITGVIASTQEYREEMARVDTAFDTSIHGIEKGREVYKDLYKVVGDHGVAGEAAQQLAELAGSEEDLSNMTEALTGVYGKWGASLPIEGLAEAVNHTAKLGEIQGPLMDALEWMPDGAKHVTIVTDSLASMSSETDRAAFLSKYLADMYKDSAKSYKENAAQIMEQRDAQLRLTDAASKLAELFIPIVTVVVEVLAGMLESFNNLGDGTKKFIITIGLLVASIGPMLMLCGLMITGMGKMVIVGGNLISTFNKTKVAGKLLGVGLRGSLGAVLGPAGWIVLGAIVVMDILKLLGIDFDWIKEKASSAADWMSNSWSSSVDWIGNKLNGFADLFTNPFENAKQKVSDFVQSIKDFFNFEIEFPDITNIPEEALSAIPGVNAVWNGAKTIKDKFFAKGGIMTDATRFAKTSSTNYIGGEAGPEAIMPLQGKNMIPFADAVAQRINTTGDNSSAVTNNFNISQLVVREEADVRKISIELEKMQSMKNRNRGVPG